MMRRYVTAVLVLVAAHAAATSYVVPRLKAIAAAVNMKVPEDLGENANDDTTWVWSKRQLRVCTDNHGAVCHIGYKLFGRNMMSDYPSPSLLQFLERYILELDLRQDHHSIYERMEMDRVVLTKGKLDYLKTVNDSTPFSINSIARRMHKATWITTKGEVELVFPADCQLIFGGNAIELETKLSERLAIQKTYNDSILLLPWARADVQTKGNMRIKDYGIYLSPMIGSRLHLVLHNSQWQPYCSPSNKIISISNMMLSGISNHDIPLCLILDRYGYKADTLQVTLRQFISYCVDEKDMVYVGIKTVDKELVTGTLFIYNEPLGFNHVLSFSFPTRILEGVNDTVSARLYAYIPLQNVTEKFFKHDTYQNYDIPN